MTRYANGVVDNIIPLHGVRTDRGVNAFRLVEGYWSSLRENGALPKRSQVHPRALSDVLAHVFILERVALGVARFRVAGAQLMKLAGLDVRGMPISTFFHTTGRPGIATALEACFDRPAVIEATLIARSVKRGPDVQGQMILLPLRSDTGEVSRILGAVQMSGRLVSDAYRLTLGPYAVKPVFPAAQLPMPSRAAAEPTTQHAPHERRLELVYSAENV